MANDIAVSLNLQSRGYIDAMRRSMDATENYSRSVSRAKVNFLSYEKGLARATAMSGQHRMVLQNSIFMVEDAASVYGTMGLAGAVRAASNNLTMMAAAFGPWGMAATVAVTTATQLYLALTKDKEAAKDASDAMAEHVEKLKEQSDAAKEASKQDREFREGSRSELADKYKEAKNQVEDTKAALQQLDEQQRKLVATRPFVIAENGGGQSGREAFEDKLNSMHAERKRLQDEYNTALEEARRHREKLNNRTAEARDAQVEVLGIVKDNKRMNEELEQSKKRYHQEELARQKEIAREESNSRFQRKLEERDREKAIQRRKQVERQENDMRNRNPSGAKMGDREFADSMARARRQGFVDPKLSQREQQSVDTLRQNKDRLQRDDMRGTFDKQRQQQIDDINKQIAAVFDKARGQAKGEMDKQTARDEKQALLEKATQDNTKQQHKTRESLDKLTQEIERAIERQSSGQSGTLVQLGGLSL